MIMNKNISVVRLLTFMGAVSSLLFLSACGDGDTRILPGERISVLQLQRELVPNAELSQTPVVLPEVWTNQYWPQVGGYPNHAMGHLTLGADLKKAWSVSVGAGGDRRLPLMAGPIVAEGLVYTLDTEGSVTAFDVATGKKRWRQSVVPRGERDTGSVGGGLSYASGKIFITCGYKFVAALDPETGAIVWKAALPAPARSAPTVMDDKVYVITLDNRLLALSAADGSALWNYTGVSEATNLLGSASVAADSSLVVLPLSSGEILGLRPENGRVAWEDNLSAVRRAGALSSIADIRGLPVLDQGIVFAVSYSGRMAALDQVTGRRVWQRELGSAEMPWTAGDILFVVTAEQQLAALTRAGGDIRWVMQLPRYRDEEKQDPIVWTGPVLAGGRLLTASSDGQMLEINVQDGNILKQHKTGGEVTIPLVVASGTLFVLTQDGDLVAWR